VFPLSKKFFASFFFRRKNNAKTGRLKKKKIKKEGRRAYSALFVCFAIVSSLEEFQVVVDVECG
jgi:hypothetical protein